MNNPLISIITPTFNREAWLPMTLQSLLDQTYPRWECIVQNDAGRSVEHIVDKFNDSGRFKYFENEKNLDLAGTRTEAIKHASGDYLILLDDDDQLYPECIEFRLGRIKKLNADVVYSKVLQNFYKPTDNGYVYAGDKRYWNSYFDKDLILIQNISPCNGIMASREAYEFAGEFDTNLHTSEDWDFWVRMSRQYFFHESFMIDCQCSYRMDNSQMSGSRTGFKDHLPYLYNKWRKYATNLDFVIEGQNAVLRQAGFDPNNYGL
jgi:glycosyltransferase involved in cell wall biosynthesis